MLSEEVCVFFYEDEDFAALTIHLQEIDVRDRVFLKKILEGDRLDFNRCAIRIILWSIRLGFDNFPPTSFVTVAAYLQESCAVLSGNGVLIDFEVSMVSVIFFDEVDTMGIGFTTNDGSSVMAQGVFNEGTLIAANINNKIIFLT